MTDHKSWLWKRRSSEKTAIVSDKLNLASREKDEEICVLLAEKAELARDLRDLSDKFSSALAECNAKDDLVKEHATRAQEALAGWEKAEAKALSLKHELDEALKQRKTSEKRTIHLDAALKECMQQLCFVREDKERRIHDVLLKASKELEETKMFLEKKLEESSKKIVKLTAENSQLIKVRLLKEQLIEDLSQKKAKLEADVDALLARLEAVEKDNSSLRYEVRVLEKEVDIRYEEREFNRRTADVTHKHHLENVKKIAKLESECQRLRVLVRKRLPGPADVAKMKSEVDVLERVSVRNRRKKSNSNLNNPQKLDLLGERINALEEENNSLREILQKKTSELQYVRKASKLSQVEAQLEESPQVRVMSDIRKSGTILHDLSLASTSDIGSDDKDRVALSTKSVGMSDIDSLMDDFAEMEKFALVSVGKPIENLNSLSEATGKESVAIPSRVDTLSLNLSTSISKLIEIIEGINLPSQDYGNNGSCVNQKNFESPTRYTVRVFQWKTSELALILQNFLHTCDDLLNGKVEFDIFAREMTSALEWIINHCFSLQCVSSMKETIKKQLDWDETRSESEMEAFNGYHNEAYCDESEEGRKSKDLLRSLDYRKQDVEEKFRSIADDCESLRNQLQASEITIVSLREELVVLKHSKALIEELFENQKMTLEDVTTQVSSLRSELNKAHEKFASVEAELKCKVNRCEALESKCLVLQLQLERMTKMGNTEHANQDEKQLGTEWEISVASEKLAECQETILHLGEQLRALASSQDALTSDKATTVTTTTTKTTTSGKNLAGQRSSLLDQMQAEDSSVDERLESPKTKEILICDKDDFGSRPAKEHVIENGAMKNGNEIAVDSLAIVPIKKQKSTSRGLFKKLLWRKNKGNSKKKQPAFYA